MRKKCDKVVDCLDAEDELNCKPLLPPSLMTDQGIKPLLSGRELEEEILIKRESGGGGPVNNIQPVGTDEETTENETNEEKSEISDVTKNLPSLSKHLEVRKSKFSSSNRMEHTSRSQLHKKDARDLSSDKQVSEMGSLDDRILDHTHVSDYNRKEEFSADSLENAQLVQNISDVLLPYNIQKLSTSYIERKAENTSDDTVRNDEVSDNFMQDDALLAALTQSYTVSRVEKPGNVMTYHETQGNTVSYGETQDSTISYGEERGISVFPGETQNNVTSRGEIQVNTMPLGETQNSTVSHAETQDNTMSYSETQRNTPDFSEAQGNTISYSETQSSTVYSETLSNTMSQSESQSSTVYNETQDNISSESTTESNLVSDNTTQNNILPEEVTKRETKSGKVRKRESRLLVAKMSDIHNARGMESIFNIMTPKEENTQSKSSSPANAQPAIKPKSSLLSNISPVITKKDILEVEFSSAESDLDAYRTLTENVMASSPLSVIYNVNDLALAKSLVLTGQNEQSLKYMTHKNEEDIGISEPKTINEVAGVFTANITSSIILHGNNDSESTSPFTEWSESLSARGPSLPSSESTHSPLSYGANVTSSLTFNCKM
jgi:hypothetical protein